MTLTVRAADSSDLDAVVALRLALLREHRPNPLFERLHPDAGRRARGLYRTHLTSPDQIVLLAEEAGEAVGILRCVHAVNSPLLLPESYAYISSAYVIPPARRGGILKSLFEEAVRWCRSRGLSELRLYVSLHDDDARAAWSALGFSPVEELRIHRLERTEGQ